jgi:hypothetical protein
MNATVADTWQEANHRYMAAALDWLRVRLERRASQGTAKSPPSSRWGLWGRSSAQVAASASLAPVNDKELSNAAAAMAEAEAHADTLPALPLLGQLLGLTRFERDVLLLCAAVELDSRIASLCARAQGNPNWPYPTFSLALALFDDPTWDALSPERALRYWRLIEIHQPGAQPLTTSPLRADERIVNYLNGVNYLDDRLAPLLVSFDAIGSANRGAGDGLPPSQQATAEAIVRHLKQSAEAYRLPVIQLLGSDGSSKQLVAEHAAASFGRRLYRLPAELLPAQASELETLARLWQRESLLLPVALYLDAREMDGAMQSDGQPSPLNRFLARVGGLSFLDTRDVHPGLDSTPVAFDVAGLTPAEQQAAWTEAIGSVTPDSPARLAGQFNLGLATINKIAQTVLAEPPSNGHTVQDRLWEGCLASTRPRMDALAQRLIPKASWKDIVRQIAAQVGQRSKVYDEWGFRDKSDRGLGISALFAGESGTGKTMAAEVIADDLRLNLYRIDLSAVVSKYIGETEKNLRRLFDAAEDGGAILFFDEADALFGKRSEVKDSHDRYANIEINYLLQRMEAYRGLAILATNVKTALDPAFVRRIRFIVDFPFPGPAERRAIWQKVFPPGTPTKGLDMDRLARLNLTGGSIYNTALNAAFLAAQAGGPVTMLLVFEAARAEYRKLERSVNEADFRWEEPAGG